MSPFCNSNSKIAIESLKYTCLRTPNCSDNAAASMAVSSGILQNAVTQVSGLRQYPYRVNQQLCTTSHTFMFMRITYYCIAGECNTEFDKRSSKTLIRIKYKG